MVAKFIFTLKSGKNVITYSHFDSEELGDKFVSDLCEGMKSSKETVCCVGKCLVRISDCSAVEWEVFEENQQG